MNEATLKSTLVDILRKEFPAAVVFRHEDKISAGIPDISVTWMGVTTWWEVKHAKPSLKSRGQQDLTMLRLHQQGRAFYIVYSDTVAEGKRVGIVRVPDYKNPQLPGVWYSGFSHRKIATFIGKAHTQ